MASILFLTHSYTHERSESYRVGQYFPYLERRGFKISLAERRENILRLLKAASLSDIVYIQRVLFSPIKFWILRRLSKRIVFDFDDAVMFGEDGKSRTRMRRFIRIVRSSDAVFCGNRFLVSIAGKFKNEGVHYIPTTVDPNLYPKKNFGGEDEPFTVGWMGTSSTLKYLHEVKEVFLRYADDPGIRFLVVADKEPDFSVKNLRFVRWERKKEKEHLLSFDLGIMPQRDDLWSMGKCGLKLIQYMATSLPSLSHPYGVSQEIIEDNVNGFLRKTPEEWIEVIEILRKDRKLCAEIGDHARKSVEERYSVHIWGEKVAETLENILA